MKQVLVDYTRCMGCRSCEIACAVEHSSSKSIAGAIFESPRPRPRIHVEQVRNFSYPVRCQHCEDAPCLMACPTGAIYRDDELGVVLVNEGRCIGCWMCTLVCPFGAIVPYFEPKFALKCDFCRERRTQGLEPACVSACPTQALVLTDVEKLTEERRIDHALKMMEAVEPRKYPPGIEIWRSGKFQF